MSIRRRLDRLAADDDVDDGLIDPSKSTDAELRDRLISALATLGVPTELYADLANEPYGGYAIVDRLTTWRGVNWLESLRARADEDDVLEADA